MSIDRAPITRPSVPGIVADSHGRVRALEAGQTMPYCYGSMHIDWPANTVLDGFGNTDDIYIFRFHPLIPYTGPNNVPWVEFDTTDETILNFLPNDPTVYDYTGGVYCTGGGLFYWEARMTAAAGGGGAAGWQPSGPYAGVFGSTIMALAPPYNQETGIAPPTSSTILPPGGAYGSGQIVSGQGTFSITGDFFGPLTDDSQNPAIPANVWLSIIKCDPADHYTVRAEIMVARWTPVGFAPYGSGE